MISFKEKVYQVVRKIPKGRVMTYKKVAEETGSPRAWRAVGNILNKNRDPKVPCHRVIKSNGKIGGYSKGTKKKLSLLKKEKVDARNVLR
jgi:O-6-methylguanine DNA methyltransferase